MNRAERKRSVPTDELIKRIEANPNIRDVVLNWSRRGGKGLEKSTQIPTPNGFIEIQHLKIGDTVFGADGKICTVTDISGLYKPKRVFRFTFNGGQEVICDGEHLWEVFTRSERHNESRRKLRNSKVQGIFPTVLLASDIADTQKKYSESNYSVALTKPVQYVEKNLSVDPYVFGFWLGDGASISGYITVNNKDVDDTVKLFSQSFNEILFKEEIGDCTTIRLSHNGKKLKTFLSEFLARDGKKLIKRIPRVYLEGSIEQRRNLLRGLIDSDGGIKKGRNEIEYYSSREDLADDVRELVQSLGFNAFKRSKVPSYTYNGVSKKGKKAYTISFSCIDNSVFTLKRYSLEATKKEKKYRYLTNIDELDNDVDVCCISVDSPDNLYLCTQSFIPTHNTHTAVTEVILPFSYYLKDCRISYITTTLKHAKDIIWTPLLNELGPLIKNRNIGEGRISVHNAHGGISVIQLMGWQTIDSIRGTANDIVIYDETQLLGDFYSNHNTAVMPTMATTKGRRFYLFTPFGFNHAYELSEEAKRNPDWLYSEATWDKFKHIDRDFVRKERARMTEAEFLQEYMCAFIKPDGLVLNEFKNDIHVFEEEIIGQVVKILCGLDFGYGNGNTAIITVSITKTKDGRDMYWITDELYKRGSELQTFEIAELLAQRKPTRVHADSADPSRIKDLLRTGLPIIPVAKHNNYKTGPNGLISRVNQAFAQDRVRIKKSCVNLISEMNMWFWNVQQDVVRPDKSTKHDAIDALLYIIGSNEEGVRQPKVSTAYQHVKKIRRYNPIGL